MNKDELYKLLDHVDHSRIKRQEISQMVLNDARLVKPLLEIGFEAHNPVSSKACWILEFTARKKLDYIFPHLDKFTLNLSTVHLASSVRPVAKICELLVGAYYSKNESTAQKTLTKNHLERITEACFDWLITDTKVAPQAYAMTSLLLLGDTFKWIHPELTIIIEQNYAKSSAAYKARARMVLAKIKAANMGQSHMASTTTGKKHS